MVILAALVRDGGPAAAEQPFRTIFEAHAPYAFRCLRRLGVAPGDVDDVLQEVFLVVLRRAGEIEADAMRPWIHGVCVRKASDYRRGARRLRARIGADPEDATTTAAADADPEDRAASRQALGRLDAALATLSAGERAAFVLHEIEQLSLKEIAIAMDRPISTVHARLERARERVARAFHESPVRSHS